MMNSSLAIFALHADPDGREVDVVLDGVGLTSLTTLQGLVPEGSRPKLNGFLSELSSAGAVAGWELPVQTSQGIRPAMLGASSVADRVAVVGYLATANMYDLYEEISRINNEQTTALRHALKRVARLEAGTRRESETMLDDMTRLNNELGALQRNMAKQNAALQRLNRQKNQLIGMVAHDLRNPLGVVTQFSKMINRLAGERLKPREAAMLGRIERTAGFMLSIVEGLLDLSAIESGEIRLQSSRFGFGELVAEAVSLEQLHAADKQTTITVESPDDFELEGDRSKLMQVVANLISNAVKYGPLNGEVRVVVGRQEQRARLCVIDQGPGIPPGERSRLFKPFGTTSVKATGGEKSTGLGLVIARKVIEAHAGTIGVETEVGTGSTFWIELPLPSA